MASTDALPLRRTTATKLIAYAAIPTITLVAYFSQRWLLDPRAFFYQDDWQWFWRSEFLGWNLDVFPVLPAAIYNDRPVGAAFLKALYQLFSVDHRSFQVALLAVHALNCVLLYMVAQRYATLIGALAAAVLAATWFSANTAAGWSAAIFDLLGATFCLAVVLLRIKALNARNAIPYDLAGALCYFLAIRTKEFAIGMIVVLLLMSVLVERQSLRRTLRELWPYLLVFAILAAKYGHLLAVAPRQAGDPYALTFSLAGVITNLDYFASALLYGPSGAEPLWITAILAAFVIAFLLSGSRARRVATWGIASFVVLLGPVLFLPARLDALYIYAPHFFVALAIGALVSGRVVPTAFAVVVVAGVIALPHRTDSRKNVIAWTYEKGETNRELYYSAVAALTPIAKGSTVFIAGVERIHNPFWIHPGNALNVAFKDVGLKVVTEKPTAELVAAFCDAKEPRRFLLVDGRRVRDSTSSIAQQCTSAKPS